MRKQCAAVDSDVRRHYPQLAPLVGKLLLADPNERLPLVSFVTQVRDLLLNSSERNESRICAQALHLQVIQVRCS